MNNQFDHIKIEKKWQKYWDSKKLYTVKDTKGNKSKKPKFYSLIEFPYPSGDGLHVGHIRSNTAMDAVSRKRRSEGYEVLYPIGWDAFGLPTENYAIKTGIAPNIVTKKNTNTFRKQLKALGFSFDWSREINTSSPAYYKWTQWIFLQMLKKGLAYKSKQNINWCPKDLIGLANEEVIDGKCERCGTQTEKREKEQWVLAITKYADRLDKDLDTVDFLEKIKIQQRNWIGRSEGAYIDFKIEDTEKSIETTSTTKVSIKVFTTLPETIYGATFLVISPEHPLLRQDHHSSLLNSNSIENKEEIKKYIEQSKKKSHIDRTDMTKEKTGVPIKGLKVINPASRQAIEVWIADYVMADYGTGAIMAVPAHDKRDQAFASKYNIPSIPVLKETLLINSGKFSGQIASQAKDSIIASVGGENTTTYKLRDWIFSRQRYWGEPIPVIHCPKCGIVPVPEEDLPVVLPKVKNYKPTSTGESPLANLTKWVNTRCPDCKGPAKRETDVMPNWAGSSWYFLRYLDTKNSKKIADPKILEKWMPVDWYNGGMEHTTLHLLYSRFWHKFLYDIGIVPSSEPYKKRTSHGLILADGGVKMSKSIGNVINPDTLVQSVGADTLRIYEMFMGPFDQAVAWSSESISGSRRFLERVYALRDRVVAVDSGSDRKSNIDFLVSETIRKFSEDIEKMSFNTAISSLMVLSNTFGQLDFISRGHYEVLIKLLSIFAPHITEEIWFDLGKRLGSKNRTKEEKISIHNMSWPKPDENAKDISSKLIAVQINGKVRAELSILQDEKEEDIKKRALSMSEVTKWIGQNEVKKIIYVKNRLINIVI